MQKKSDFRGLGLKPHLPRRWRYNANVNVPPPFSPPPAAPPKKTNTALILGIVLACILIPCIGLIVVGAMGFNFFKNTIGPMASCAIGFTQVRRAIEDYADAHEGKLPNAATWQDDVRPFYEKLSATSKDEYGPFDPMKADGDWGCKAGGHSTGMAFNAELSGKKLADIKDPYETMLIFEIETAVKNANQPYKHRSKDTSPTFMGEKRGWIEMPVKGGSKGFDMGRRGSKFEVKTDSSSDDSESK